MKCPFCGFLESKVLDTRLHKDGEAVRRRRECLQCRGRFTTQEGLLQQLPFVIKKDGRREPFSKDKLLKGIQAACQKRPISLAQMEQLVEKISKWILDRCEREVSSDAVGHKVMMELKNVDHVAYIRFASVYRTFKDVNEFVESLDKPIHPISDQHEEEPKPAAPRPGFSPEMGPLG